MHDEASKKIWETWRNLLFCLFFRRCEWTTFSFVFGYLFFFRTCAYYGFEKPPPHSNAIQLLITLRVMYSINISFNSYMIHVYTLRVQQSISQWCNTDYNTRPGGEGPQYNNLTFYHQLNMCQILQVPLLFFPHLSPVWCV